MLHGRHERSANAGEATAFALNWASSMGLSLETISVGNKLKTSSCEITGPNGQTAIGRGKGFGEQSITSAIFEAIEHYFFQYEKVLISQNNFKLEGPEAVLESASPDLSKMFKDKVIPLSCIEFECLIQGYPNLNYPAILVNPAYQPLSEQEKYAIESTRIYRYSTNSGTAAGLTKSESQLHGILELVERDAIGILFIESVLSKHSTPVREINMECVPYYLKNIIKYIYSEFDCSITIWDITTDNDIPCVLCRISLPSQDGDLAFFGSGASLDIGYAAERALLEALQGCHLQLKLGVVLQLPKRHQPERMSLFQRCCLDSGSFFFRGGTTLVNPSGYTQPTHSYGSVEDQLASVLERLDNVGIRVYSRQILDGDISISQVIAPLLERFYLISHGIPILPGLRGRSFLR